MSKYIFVTEELFSKLMDLLQEVMGRLTCSARNMARLRGKAQHQLRCIEGVRPFLVRFDIMHNEKNHSLKHGGEIYPSMAILSI